MASRQITLASEGKKSDAVAADAGSASANVIVAFDNALPQLEVVNALKKVIEKIVEDEY